MARKMFEHPVTKTSPAKMYKLMSGFPLKTIFDVIDWILFPILITPCRKTGKKALPYSFPTSIQQRNLNLTHFSSGGIEM